MAKQQIKINPPDHIAKAIAKLFNVSPRYVRMIRDNQRKNDKILAAYEQLKQDTADLIEQTRQNIIQHYDVRS